MLHSYPRCIGSSWPCDQRGALKRRFYRRWFSGVIFVAGLCASTFAQNSNLSDHDRYLHLQSERNTQYFNNADSYPKLFTDNYARYLAQQAALFRRNDAAVVAPPDPVEFHTLTREEYFQEMRQKSESGSIDARIKLADCYYSGWGVAENKAKALALYRDAGASHPHAEFIAGVMLFAGDGVKANLVEGRALIQHAATAGDTEARSWRPLIEKNLERAAKGDVTALADAGGQFIYGIGIEQDIPRGVKMKQEAAERGDLLAMQNLAYWYRTPGTGVLPSDIEKSHAWLLKAAEAGDVNAMQAVGADYFLNEGIPVDANEGLRWSLKAAEKGNATAMENLGVIYNGSYPGIKADRGKAEGFYRRAIAAGSATAADKLARLFEGTDGAPPDYKRGFETRKPLAEKGNADSEMHLGVYYDQGLGIEQDTAKAIEWFTKAAQQGSPRAIHELAVHTLDGTGLKEDAPKAIQLYRQAATLGFPASLDSLGMFTFTGACGVPQDELEGIRLFQLAAEKGDGDACRNLALIYDEGIGIDEDKAEALRWFKAGARAGDKKCIQKLKADGISYAKTDGAGKGAIPFLRVTAEKATLTPPGLKLDTVKSAEEQIAENRTKIVVPARKHNYVDYTRHLLDEAFTQAKMKDGTLTPKAWALSFHDQALAGNVEACYWWGAVRLAAFGVKLGPNQEVEHYLAVPMKAGKPEAEIDYAILLWDGRGVASDHKKAFELVRKAAGTGLPSAQNLLGEFYNAGVGTEKDQLKAVECWKKAAESGDVIGEYFYGLALATGDGVPANESVGMPMLKKAADAGDDRAQFNYGTALSEGLAGLTPDVTAGTAYQDKAALAGNVKAQNAMGHNYAHGVGVEQDDLLASLYWEAAAINGNDAAQFTFAERKYYGVGTKKNKDEGIEWLKKSADQGNDDAIADLKEFGVEWTPRKTPSSPK